MHQNQECTESVSTSETKYKSLEANEKRLEEKVRQYKAKEAEWEGKMKALEGQGLVDLEQLWNESNKAIENYKADTKAKMKEYLPKLRSNLMLHAQVIVGPFASSQVDFICM